MDSARKKLERLPPLKREKKWEVSGPLRSMRTGCWDCPTIKLFHGFNRRPSCSFSAYNVDINSFCGGGPSSGYFFRAQIKENRKHFHPTLCVVCNSSVRLATEEKRATFWPVISSFHKRNWSVWKFASERQSQWMSSLLCQYLPINFPRNILKTAAIEHKFGQHFRWPSSQGRAMEKKIVEIQLQIRFCEFIF